MKNNFECCYMSVGGTFCLYHERDIIDDLNNNECNSCDMNNSCEYCLWKLTQHEENCGDCKVLEDEK